MLNILTYFQNHTTRFFFIYGETSDEFITADLQMSNLEKVLHGHLKSLGYERIAFYQGTKGLHCFDQRSFELSFDTEKNSGISQKKSVSSLQGPLGKRILSQPKKIEERFDVSKPLSKPLNDVDIVTHFNTLINDDEIKTALIFTNLDDFIKHTTFEVIRDFSSNLNDWEKLTSKNKNIVIFIAPKGMNREKNEETSSRFAQWENLLAKQNVDNVIRITQPKKDEIINLLNYYRLFENKSINWLEFDEIVELLRKIVKEKSLSLKMLSSKIANINNLNKKEISKMFDYNLEAKGLEKLKSLQGLDYLTNEIDRLVRYAKSKKIEIIQPKSKELQRIVPQPRPSMTDANLNIALLGNPGTGKTTVAKIISEIFKENGIFEIGHIIEAKADDLVAKYVGQTAIKTQEVIEKAMGGVLFIDEAYKLTETENSFGQEAVNAIVEAMTARAGQFAVIIAGYPEQINNFLESNPGLHRRFANQIVMKDYEPKVLESIFRDKMVKDEYGFDEEMEELFSYFIKNWFEARDEKKFGNAGDVINLFDDMAKNALFDGRKFLRSSPV